MYKKEFVPVCRSTQLLRMWTSERLCTADHAEANRAGSKRSVACSYGQVQDAGYMGL